MRITCALRKAGRWDARSATSSLSPCAEGTIARSITAAMKQCGGGPPELIRPLRPVRCGGETHPLPKGRNEKRIDGPTSIAARKTDTNKITRNGSIDEWPSQNKANYRSCPPMTSFRQWQANRNNARKSTGPVTEEGKKRSRCNAVRHGLTAETVIGVLEDAEDYRAFEAAIIADYDAQSAVERELVLRLASLLWRLRRAAAMETGLFVIQAEHLDEYRKTRRQLPPASRDVVFALFGAADGHGSSQTEFSIAAQFAFRNQSLGRARAMLLTFGQHAKLCARSAEPL